MENCALNCIEKEVTPVDDGVRANDVRLVLSQLDVPSLQPREQGLAHVPLTRRGHQGLQRPCPANCVCHAAVVQGPAFRLAAGGTRCRSSQGTHRSQAAGTRWTSRHVRDASTAVVTPRV